MIVDGGASNTLGVFSSGYRNPNRKHGNNIACQVCMLLFYYFILRKVLKIDLGCLAGVGCIVGNDIQNSEV